MALLFGSSGNRGKRIATIVATVAYTFVATPALASQNQTANAESPGEQSQNRPSFWDPPAGEIAGGDQQVQELPQIESILPLANPHHRKGLFSKKKRLVETKLDRAGDSTSKIPPTCEATFDNKPSAATDALKSTNAQPGAQTGNSFTQPAREQTAITGAPLPGPGNGAQTALHTALPAQASGAEVQGTKQTSSTAVPLSAEFTEPSKNALDNSRDRAPSNPPPRAVSVLIPLPVAASDGPIVVDSDEEPAAKPAEAKFVWKEIADSPDKIQITAGTEFPVVCVSCLNSKTAKPGDRVEARLKVDIKIGGKMIAPKGSKVIGHVSSAHPARRLLVAELKLRDRWMRANGAIGLQFDEIVNNKNEHMPLIAVPARHARIVNNKNEGRVLGVNHEGQIASPLSIQLKHQGVHLAIRGAAAVGGVFSMGALPVAFGVIGAMDPSFAFMHPVGKNVHHRRLKGFGMGVLSGLPGGFIVADFVVRGTEAEVKPGDEFLVSFKQDFNGRVATEAELLPGVKTRVQGEVLTKTKKSKKKAHRGAVL